MLRRRTVSILTAAAAISLIALAACNKEPQASTEQTPSAAAPNAAPAANAGPLTPEAGGKIIVVELYSDASGNYFKPAQIHAKRGDVIRYTLKVGVHNVHFLADSNAGKSGFPAAPSDYLQLPGQTYDVAVKMAPGTYYFQCDPHAALGMRGRVIVE